MTRRADDADRVARCICPDPPSAHHPGMDRRRFLLTSLAGALAAPLVAEALEYKAGKVPLIGLLGTATSSLMSSWLTAFREGLRERGYVQGQNIAIEYRWGDGKPERFPGLAAELVGLKADVIVTSGPQAIRAAQRATRVIPIVMAIVEDPVEQGFVTSLARPGGNLTGLSFQDSELVTKRLQLLREAIPEVSRVAVLWDSVRPNALKAVERGAPSLGLVLQVLEVRGEQDLERAFAAARQQRAQAVIQLASPLFAAHRTTILSLMAKGRLPAVCQERTFVVDGCLIAYGPSFPDMFRRAAYYVERILKGAKPADLPVEQTTKFELVINLKDRQSPRPHHPAVAAAAGGSGDRVNRLAVSPSVGSRAALDPLDHIDHPGPRAMAAGEATASPSIGEAPADRARRLVELDARGRRASAPPSPPSSCATTRPSCGCSTAGQEL